MKHLRDQRYKKTKERRKTKWNRKRLKETRDYSTNDSEATKTGEYKGI